MDIPDSTESPQSMPPFPEANDVQNGVDILCSENILPWKDSVGVPQNQVSTHDAEVGVEINSSPDRRIISDHEYSPVKEVRDNTLLEFVSASVCRAEVVTLAPAYMAGDDVAEHVGMASSPTAWSEHNSSSETSSPDILAVSPYAYEQSPYSSGNEAPAHSPDSEEHVTSVPDATGDTDPDLISHQTQSTVVNGGAGNEACNNVAISSLNECCLDEHLEQRTCDVFSEDTDMTYLLSEDDKFFQEIDNVLRNKLQDIDTVSLDDEPHITYNATEGHDESNFTSDDIPVNKCTESRQMVEANRMFEPPYLGTAETDDQPDTAPVSGVAGSQPQADILANEAALENDDMDDIRGISPEIICMTHLSPTDIYSKEATLGVPRLISRQSTRTGSSLNTPDPIEYIDSDSGKTTPIDATLKLSCSEFIPDNADATSLFATSSNSGCKRKLDDLGINEPIENKNTVSQQQCLLQPQSSSYDFMNQISQYNGRPPDISTWAAVNSHPVPRKYDSGLPLGYFPGYSSMMGDHNQYGSCTQQFGYGGGLGDLNMAGQFTDKPTCTVTPSVASPCNTNIGNHCRSSQMSHPYLNPSLGSLYMNPSIPSSDILKMSCQFASSFGQQFGPMSIPRSICHLDFSSPPVSPLENYPQIHSFPVQNFVSNPSYLLNLSRPEPVLPVGAPNYPNNMNTYHTSVLNNNTYTSLAADVNNNMVVDTQLEGATDNVFYPQTTSALPVVGNNIPSDCSSNGLPAPSLGRGINRKDNEMKENVKSNGNPEPSEEFQKRKQLGWGTKQVTVPLTARNTQLLCPVSDLGSRKVADLIQSAEKQETAGKRSQSVVSPPDAHKQLNEAFTRDFLQQRKTKSPSSAFCAVLDLSKKAESERLKNEADVSVIAQPPVAMPVQALLNQNIPNVNFQGKLLLPYLASVSTGKRTDSSTNAHSITQKSTFVPIAPNNMLPDKVWGCRAPVIPPPVNVPVGLYNGTPHTAYISRLPLYSPAVHSGSLVTCSLGSSRTAVTSASQSFSQAPVVSNHAAYQNNSAMSTVSSSHLTQVPSNAELLQAHAVVNRQFANHQLNPQPLNLQARPSSQAGPDTCALYPTMKTDMNANLINPVMNRVASPATYTGTKPLDSCSQSNPVPAREPPITYTGTKPSVTSARTKLPVTCTGSKPQIPCAGSMSVPAREPPVASKARRPSGRKVAGGSSSLGQSADTPVEDSQPRVCTYYPIPVTQPAKKVEHGRRTFKARHCYFTCLQIGTFRYMTAQMNYDRTARVKFIYSKRKLVYEFQLNNAKDIVEKSQRELAEVEVPFSSICSLWLCGKDLRLQVDAAPKMHLGSRHWERNIRYGPYTPAIYNRGTSIDLTDGQLDEAPYHYVQFKTNCGDRLRDEWSQFDSRFATMLKLPHVEDRAQTLRPPETEVVSHLLQTLQPSTSSQADPVSTTVGPVDLCVACQCTNGCSCQQCACCVHGLTCTEGECGCTDCRNPLNILHQLGIPAPLARTDPCLMENIYQVKKLDYYVNIEVHVECCNVSVQLINCIPGVFTCPVAGCHTRYQYSWCSAVLCNEDMSPRNHCTECGRCTDYRYTHCQRCNICYFAGESGSFKCPVCHNRKDGQLTEMDSSTDSDP